VTRTSIHDRLRHRWKRVDESWRFAITAFISARVLFSVWAWIILTIQPLAVQNIELSGEPVLTVFHTETSAARSYSREVDGQILTFRAEDRTTMVDLQTGGTWNASTGESLKGPFAGSTLRPAQTPPSKIFPYHSAAAYRVPWLAVWQRFDTNWYLSIAEEGYGSINGDVHFPPFFPLLIRALKPLIGNAYLAALLIANLATLYAIKLLYEVYLEWGNTSSAKRSIALFLLYPTSFFLFAAYSESLFLMATLLSLRYMRAHLWALAGFWCFCALLTRLQGIALILPMLYMMWLDRPLLRKPAHQVGLMLPGLGGLFYLYLRSQQATGNVIPLVESELHARLVPPWGNYWYAVETFLSGHFTLVDFLNWIAVTLFTILLVTGWRRIPTEYNLFTAASLLILLARLVETQPLVSMTRYTLTLFPAFFVLSLASEDSRVRRLIVYTFIPLNLYLSAQFFSWGWVA
jgi:hypothetical protein